MFYNKKLQRIISIETNKAKSYCLIKQVSFQLASTLDLCNWHTAANGYMNGLDSVTNQPPPPPPGAFYF